MSSSPAAISSCSWKKPKACPNQIRYIISPVASSSRVVDTRRSLPSWTCLVNLHREAPRRHLIQMPETPQLAPFNTKEQQVYSRLSRCHPISVEESHLSHFAIEATTATLLLTPHQRSKLLNQLIYCTMYLCSHNKKLQLKNHTFQAMEDVKKQNRKTGLLYHWFFVILHR